MSAVRIAVLTVAAAFASAGAAQAAESKPRIDFTVRQEAPVLPAAPKAMVWDARRGKWGLTLNLDQSDVRPSTLNDVAAGAYYRITPSLRVGGAVALGEQQVTPGVKQPGAAADEGQPRVRLETRFKF
jgi:hypothetical protein